MEKRDLVSTLNGLRINGDTNIVIETGDFTHEFKLIRVANRAYIVYSGRATSLRWFHAETPKEHIADEFEIMLKGLDLRLEQSKVISSDTFL